jgi:hypothetical protein
LVSTVTARRRRKNSAPEAEVNDRVYGLFGLTRDEIKLIEETP